MVPIAMGRRSKALLTCLHNLSKALLRSYKATVKNALDSDADDVDYIMNDDTGSISNTCSDTEGDGGLNGIRGRFFALEDDLDSVSGSDLEGMDLDDDKEVEIKNDIALLTCSAVAAEKKKWGSEEKTQVLYPELKPHSLKTCLKVEEIGI